MGKRKSNKVNKNKNTTPSPLSPRPTIDLDQLESGTTLTSTSCLDLPYSPRNDLQLGGYPPDCGTNEHKYLSYAKVLHERGKTHPMSYSTTKVDAIGNPLCELYSLDINFGAHSFHRLPTDSFVLSQYGIGMTLYFKYLKVMTWLFFILVLLSTPSMLIYIIGGADSFQEFKILAKQNFPLVFGMTTIGHLKASSSTCDQVVQGDQVSLVCPAGEIGFIKAIYSAHDTQGSCTCPELNKVADGNGQCRGKPVETCNGLNCTTICPIDGYGCFQGLHPVSKWTCCATKQDPHTLEPDFNDMRLHTTPGCMSYSIQTIANGLCLGKKSCSFRVSEDLMYEWKIQKEYNTTCGNQTMEKEKCQMKITDHADFTQCSNDTVRGVILYARCFTTRIDLSNEWSLKVIGWDTITRNNFLFFAVGSDLVCSICFFIIVLWMKRKEKENVEKITKDQIKVMDYTVQLMHLPRHSDVNLLREEIRMHLETLLTNAPRFAKDLDRIRIADIQFGKRTSGYLHLLRQRGDLVRQLEIAQHRLEKIHLLQPRFYAWNYTRKVGYYQKQISALEKKIQIKNQQLVTQPSYDGQAITAFITFEEEEGYHRCLMEYPDYGFLYRIFQSHSKRLHGKRLRFRPAPDPTDIVWENLKHPYWERLLRQFGVALITCLVLCISFILILLAKLQKTRLERTFGRPTTCPIGVTKEQVVEDEIQKEIGLVPYKAIVECYCKNVLLHESFGDMTREVFYNPVTQTSHLYCKTWSTSFLTTQIYSILSVLMVVLINVLLARILNTLVRLEKHHTESSQVVSRVTKVFIAQVFNTAILMIIINANLTYFIEAKTWSFEQIPILNGKYGDFTPEWYNDVGVALILTMIINTISPHLYLVIEYGHQQWKRFQDRYYSFDYTLTKQDTQRDLEALYRGPPFDLAARYAQSLTSIFITYMFSAGMPFLHIVGFMEMMMTYWADKFTFLRITRSPPLYDAKVATATGSLLPYAVIVHSLIAMWMFSNQNIFQTPSDILKQLSNDHTISIGEGIPSFEMEKGHILQRLTRPQVVILLGFFLVFGLVMMLRLVLFHYFSSFVINCCPILAQFTQKANHAKGIPNYFDAIPTSILRDKVVAPHVKDSLRSKYMTALERREVASPRRSPKRRNKRTISAAEHYQDQQWIVGCPSYAIGDNKEYVDALAIDSYISGGIQLDQIL